MGIARPVMKVHPWAWCYFVPFVMISSYIVLNVLVGVVVNAVGNLSDEEDEKTKGEKETKNITNAELMEEINDLKAMIKNLEKKLEEKG